MNLAGGTAFFMLVELNYKKEGWKGGGRQMREKKKKRGLDGSNSSMS
jgi:hypothetical protein